MKEKAVGRGGVVEGRQREEKKELTLCCSSLSIQPPLCLPSHFIFHFCSLLVSHTILLHPQLHGGSISGKIQPSPGTGVCSPYLVHCLQEGPQGALCEDIMQPYAADELMAQPTAAEVCCSHWFCLLSSS